MTPAAPTQRASGGAGALAGALQTLAFLAYPFVVYTAYTRLGVRWLGGLLLALYALSVLLRSGGSRDELAGLARQHAPLAVLVVAGIASGERLLLLLLPGLVSLYLLWSFARTLREGPPMVERLARAIEDDLPDFCVPYCRKVTWVWCVFLAANTAAVVALAVAAPLGWWAVYTGLLFYLLMGALLGGEFVVRKLWFRHYQDGAADRFFERVFPPERTANGRRSLAYARARREKVRMEERPQS